MYLKKYGSLFLIPFLFILFAPSVLGTYYCAGTSACIQYNKTYVYTPSGTTNTGVFLDTNDTTNKYPQNIFLQKLSDANFNQVWVLDSSFNDLYTITLGGSKVYNNAGFWWNNSGTEEITGGDLVVGTDKFNFWLLNGSYITQINFNEDDWSGSDWSADTNYIYVLNQDDDSIDIYNTSLSLIDSVSVIPDLYPAGLQVSNTYSDYVFFIDRTNKRLYVENVVSKLSMGYIGLDSFGITGANLVPYDVMTNFDDSKLWISVWNHSGTDYYYSILEFELGMLHTDSTIGLMHPSMSENYNNNNIVFELALNSGYNGTLYCYVDGSSFYNNTYSAGANSVSFLSGTLTNGQHNWSCNYTDYLNYSYSSVTNIFYINAISISPLGDGIASLFGFTTDAYSTASEKGLFFMALIICIVVSALVSAFIVKHGDGEGAGVTFIVIFLAFFLMFAFVGWIPAWILIMFLVITGLIISGLIYGKISGG